MRAGARELCSIAYRLDQATARSFDEAAVIALSVKMANVWEKLVILMSANPRTAGTNPP